MKEFANDDIVEATKPWSRKDCRCHLEIRDRAKVISTWRGNGPQIISIEILDGNYKGMQMIDIVCSANVPLRKV